MREEGNREIRKRRRESPYTDSGTCISTILGTYLILEESISSCFEEKLCGRYISSLSREEES